MPQIRSKFDRKIDIMKKKYRKKVFKNMKLIAGRSTLDVASISRLITLTVIRQLSPLSQ